MKEVYCSGTSAGLVVGLLVGGIIVVCLIAYGYAKWKAYKKRKEGGGAISESTVKAQPVTRAAKIAARNDMVVTGVVSQAAIKSGVVRQAPSAPTGKLVTGEPEQYDYHHQSVSNQYSNPPPYHSIEQNEERGRNSTTSSKSRSKRSRNSTSDHPQSQRKHRAYHDEYTEEVDLGYHEGSSQPTLEGQFYSVQNNGPMVSDYYRPSNQRSNQRYGAMDHDYYARDVGPQYPDHYLNGTNDVGYGYSQHEKPYHVPI